MTELVMIQESVVSLNLRIDKIEMFDDLPNQALEASEDVNFNFIPG